LHANPGDGLQAVFGRADLKALALEQVDQMMSLGGRIIDDQNDTGSLSYRARARSILHRRRVQSRGHRLMVLGSDIRGTLRVAGHSAQQAVFGEGLAEIVLATHQSPPGPVEQTVLAREHHHRRVVQRGTLLDQRAGLIAIQWGIRTSQKMRSGS